MPESRYWRNVKDILDIGSRREYSQGKGRSLKTSQTIFCNPCLPSGCGSHLIPGRATDSRRGQTPRHYKTGDHQRSLGFYKAFGGGLLLLSLLPILIAPFTEGLSTLDNFPRSGQDFELSSFLLITFLCLPLLAAFRWKRELDRFLEDEEREPRQFWEAQLELFKPSLSASAVWEPPRKPFSSGLVPLPLRI